MHPPSFDDPLGVPDVEAVGSRGDSYDNAMAESMMGRSDTPKQPLRGVDDVEYQTLD